MPAISDRRIRTLGLRTDLAIESERAIVREHDAFIAVRTPSNPDYHFGNYLIFDRAGDEAYLEGFRARGYAFQYRAVLTASQVREFPLPSGLHVRLLESDEDWSAQYELGMVTREDVYEIEAYARFKAAQIAYHRQIARRLGAWLGVFDGAHLVGSCGIYAVGGGIARYQDVGVLPVYRNRGIARCLLGTAARYAADRLGATQFVIVADAGDFPRRIYEGCGFTLYQRECALWISNR